MENRIIDNLFHNWWTLGRREVVADEAMGDYRVKSL